MDISIEKSYTDSDIQDIAKRIKSKYGDRERLKPFLDLGWQDNGHFASYRIKTKIDVYVFVKPVIGEDYYSVNVSESDFDFTSKSVEEVIQFSKKLEKEF